jgi:short-subunit dehydrogenase
MSRKSNITTGRSSPTIKPSPPFIFQSISRPSASYRAVVEHMSEPEEQHQFDTNYFGAVGLIRLVLPYMREIGRGKIINVSSVSGMLAMPTMGSYSASKYALEGLSEALWYEVRPLGINVSLIQPGFVKSKCLAGERGASTLFSWNAITPKLASKLRTRC